MTAKLIIRCFVIGCVLGLAIPLCSAINRKLNISAAYDLIYICEYDEQLCIGLKEKYSKELNIKEQNNG